MAKFLLIFFITFNASCFAIEEAVWELYWWKDWYKFFIIAEQIEQTKEPRQKEILKINLSTEAKYLEKLIHKEIKNRLDRNIEVDIELYEMINQIHEILNKNT